MPPVSIPKILAATIVQTVVLSAIYFYSLYHRLGRVNPREFQICLDQYPRDMQICASRLMFEHLTDPAWLCIQFTLLVVPATVLAYLFCRTGIARPVTQSALIALLTALGLTLVMKQGLFAAAVAAIGSLLGGQFARRRLDRVIIFNQKNRY